MKALQVLIICNPEHREKVSFSDYDHESVAEINLIADDIRKAAKQITQAHIIVTCGDWNNSNLCVKAVEVARLLDFEVIHQTRFLSYVEQNHNR